MDSYETMPRIVELAAAISNSVAKLQGMLETKGIPSPSFDESFSLSIPSDATGLQDTILDASLELHQLLLSPLDLVFIQGGHNNMVSIQAITRCRISDMIPDGGQMSFEDIAQQAGLSVQMTRRLLRHAMTMRIFREKEPGIVEHTAASKLLKTQHMNDWFSAGSEEMWPAAVKMVDAIQKWPGSQSPNETAFALANNTSDNIYGILGADPNRAMRFANAMKSFAKNPAYQISDILDHYDWSALGAARVVDIGGSTGNVALQLAERFPNLDITVQDLESVVQHASVPTHLSGRVRFMAHDIFTPQIVRADVYYLRMVLHNWSDQHCIDILRAQIAALSPGAKLLIHETIMPEPRQVALWKEKNLRSVDLNMAAVFNSLERTADEWTSLLSQADSRYELKRIIEMPGSALGIIEVYWNGKEE